MRLMKIGRWNITPQDIYIILAQVHSGSWTIFLDIFLFFLSGFVLDLKQERRKLIFCSVLSPSPLLFVFLTGLPFTDKKVCINKLERLPFWNIIITIIEKLEKVLKIDTILLNCWKLTFELFWKKVWFCQTKIHYLNLLCSANSAYLMYN